MGRGDDVLKRVAVVGPLPPRPGGVSVQTQSLAAAWQGEGLDVQVVNTDLPALRRLPVVGRLLLVAAQPLALAWRLSRWAGGCQIVHVQASSYWGFMPAAVAALLKPRRGWRLVVTYHGHQAEQFLRRAGGLVRWALGRADAVIALSGWAAGHFRRAGIATEEVPILVPVERFPFQPRGALRPVVVWARHFTPAYQPALAVQAVARVRERVPALRLHLLGRGPLQGEVAALAERLGVPAEFVGSVPFEEMARQYQKADLFLNTSDFDNFPATLIEASACGLPVVTTAAGGIPYMVQDGLDALVAPVGDVGALAEAMERVLSDGDLAARLSAAGRRNAERCAWPAVRERLWAVYRRALGEGQVG
ncbi:MAG: glycosyltransferase family 4 protein [Chloroflexi bacterium]|nr:glycosyltransferase family 4 protein [Chloroflexota bacterium]